MILTLAERQQQYEDAYNQKIIRRIPIIVNITGKNFNRLTKMITKPYCAELTKIFAESLLYSVSEFQGAIFGFTFSDEACFILTNDQSNNTEPWLDNKIQDITSVASSTFTNAFYKNQLALDIDLDLVGDPIFRTHVWGLPSIQEAINYISWRQIIAYKLAVTEAALSELGNKFGLNKTEEMLENLTVDERKDLLLKHCGINFDEFYPSHWYRGVAVYRTPVIKNENIRNKWNLNWELPFFMDDKEFLINILTSK